MPNRSYDDEIDMRDGKDSQDREITLGGTMILGLFLALVVLCAVFFGLGYQVGRKSLAGQPVAKDPAPANSGVLAEKPSAGSPLVSSQSRSPEGGATVTVPDTPMPTPVATRVADTESEGAGSAAAQVVPVGAPQPLTRAAVVASPSSTASPSLPGWVVQVAAVSHKEDADLLAGELKRRGYSVGIHSDAADKLLHVQIGPVAGRKDADAMRQRLLNDGFNAIVKEIH